MIEVTVRYSPSYANVSGVVLDIRDRVESAVAQVCEKEQEHVDVSMSPWGADDEHGHYSTKDDIFVKIDVDACDAHGRGLSADDFSITLVEQFHQIFGEHGPRPRVWVRPIAGGSFAE